MIFSSDGVNIHFWTSGNTYYPKNTACYSNVTEVDALYKQFKPYGIVHPNEQLQDMPWEMRQFSIMDNNGNILHFGEDIT